MKLFIIGALFGGILVFLLGIPPFSFIANHYFVKFHPVARQLKVVNTFTEAQSLFAITAAVELGVFDALVDKPLTILELAERIKASPRGVDALVNSLCQSDYLYSNGDGTYTNSATSLYHLTNGVDADKDMKPLVRLMGSTHMVKLMGTTSEAVKNGGSVLDDDHAEQFDHPFWHIFSKVITM